MSIANKMKPSIKNNLIRIICLLILASLCLVGCSSNKKSKIRNNDYNKSENASPAFKEVGEQSGNNSGKETTKINNSTSNKKRVALTFDDGPHNEYTKKIVDELSKYGFNATFFVVGNRVDGTAYNGGEALKYAAKAGNELAIHGYTHDPKNYYDKCSDSVYQSELSNTQSAILSKVPNANVRLMRPVGGKITDERIKSSKYSVIMWGVDSEDWKYKYYPSTDSSQKKQKLDTIVDNVMSKVSDGSIILMHDIYLSTYDATVIILKQLHEQGYEVVTVSELIGKDLSAGKQYFGK